MYYFSASTKSKDKGELGLTFIKVHKEIDKNPYLAFNSMELGERFLAHMNMDKLCYIVPESELHNHMEELNINNGIILFNSFSQILKAYGDQNNFDFKKLVIPYLHIANAK